MAQRYHQAPSYWLMERPSTDGRDSTEEALYRLNLDLGVYLAGLTEDERIRLEFELRQRHGF